jgi:hypothetical protein
MNKQKPAGRRLGFRGPGIQDAVAWTEVDGEDAAIQLDAFQC